MDNQQFTIISDLIVKYIMNTITHEEQATLDAWISERKENMELFSTIISSENLYNKIDCYSDKKYQNAYCEFIARKNTSRKKIVSFKNLMRYAGVIAILLISLYGIYFFEESEPQKKLQLNASRGYAVPILKLSDGKMIRFDSVDFVDGIAEKNQVISMEKDKIEYPNEVASSEKLSYNELIVPNQCRHKIILSDKSVVWVNANSTLRYPVLFGSTERRVYITGEALFEVAKDSLRPFIVETNCLSVNVTGTLFNVDAYPEQSNAKVTLVNGSICSNVKNQSYTLVPNQQLIFDKESDSAELRDVIANDYTLWVNGTYVFNKTKLKDIIALIERCYDINCHLKDNKYLEMEITGELNVNKGVMSFVDLLSKCSDFKFSLEEGAITIH